MQILHLNDCLCSLLSGVQYEVHIQYQPDVKAKLDIAHFQRNWFSGWSVPDNYETFDLQTLLGDKVTSSHMMRSGFSGVMFIQKRVYCILFRKRCYSKMMPFNDFVKIRLFIVSTDYILVVYIVQKCIGDFLLSSLVIPMRLFVT